MKFILAEKKEMTQKFAEDGSVVPVTKVVAGPCVITQIKRTDKDGYIAIQVGFGTRKNIAKPQRGHFKDLGNFRYVKEFRVTEEQLNGLEVGNTLTVSTFQNGDVVKVSGQSKGKGFAGVVKRYGFHGSPATHGHKDQLRMPGSIGAGGPSHVFKGTRMGGHMGDQQVTVSNLRVVEIDPEHNELFIKGAIPGARNNLVWITAEGELSIEKPAVAELKQEEKSEAQPDAAEKIGDEQADVKAEPATETEAPKEQITEPVEETKASEQEEAKEEPQEVKEPKQ